MAFTEADIDRVRQAAAEVIEQHHLPGIAIGVVSGSDLVYSEGFGYADIESQEPQRPERAQRIASITKTMVGLSTMALVDEGRLSLDDRVIDHLPELAFDGPGDQIRIRHLLTHTSGIGEAPTRDALIATVNPNPGERAQPGGFDSLYPNGIVVEAQPGTKWAYSNNGFALLGEILARTEKATLHETLSKRIFEPLGMKDSHALDTRHPALTTGYHRPVTDDNRELFARQGIPIRDEPLIDGHNIRGQFSNEFNSGMRAAGAVQSTIPDMARYAAALLQRGAGIVRPETFDAMVGPQWCPDDRLESWGLSFSRMPKFGLRTFGHGGAYFGGWNSNLTVMPEPNLAVVMHANVMLDSSASVFNRMLRAVLGVAMPVLPDIAMSDDLLAALPGVYECTPGSLTNFRPSTRIGRIQITRNAEGLTLCSRRGDWKAGVRLRAADAADANFVAVQTEGALPAYFALTRGADGRVDALRFDELNHMVRNDSIEPWAG